MLSARFLLSAASSSDFPRTGLPEIALVGRSNVGKSSLINALARQKVARTSAAPGKTRLANYYLVQSPIPNPQSPSFYFVDLPGYGYARGGDESARAFDVLAAQYFSHEPGAPRRIAGVLHVVDSRHPELPQDRDAREWLSGTGRPLAVAASKVDKLSQAERRRHLKLLQEHYGDVLPFSSASGEGLDGIVKAIRAWLV